MYNATVLDVMVHGDKQDKHTQRPRSKSENDMDSFQGKLLRCDQLSPSYHHIVIMSLYHHLLNHVS